jgi:hypothetical protein
VSRPISAEFACSPSNPEILLHVEKYKSFWYVGCVGATLFFFCFAFLFVWLVALQTEGSCYVMFMSDLFLLVLNAAFICSLGSVLRDTFLPSIVFHECVRIWI